MINTQATPKLKNNLEQEFVARFFKYTAEQLLIYNKTDYLIIGLYDNGFYIGPKDQNVMKDCYYIDRMQNPKINQNMKSIEIKNIVNYILKMCFTNIDIDFIFKHISYSEKNYSHESIVSWIIDNYFDLSEHEHTDIALYEYIATHIDLLTILTSYWLNNIALIEKSYQVRPEIMNSLCGPYAYYYVDNLNNPKLKKNTINVFLQLLDKIILNNETDYVSGNFIRASLLFSSKVTIEIPYSWINSTIKELQKINADFQGSISEMLKYINLRINFNISNSDSLAKMINFVLTYDNNICDFKNLIKYGFSFTIDQKYISTLTKIKVQLSALATTTNHAEVIEAALQRLDMMFNL